MESKNKYERLPDHISRKTKAICKEYDDIVAVISSDVNQSVQFKDAVKRLGEIEAIVNLRKQYDGIVLQVESMNELAQEETDEELKLLVREELVSLLCQLKTTSKNLTEILSPENKEDSKNAIVEIRPGTGGDEASLFAKDLFRMYMKYSEKKEYAIEIFTTQTSEKGGFKEIIFIVKGKGTYGNFKYESGVHRVQRIPVTESSGRIHTSAATVAVFSEADETKCVIDQKDLRIDTFSSSGAGGQHVNRTASAVRITHIPTGIVISCQAERSQLQNRARALKVLKARLRHLQETEQKKQIAAERKQQVQTGDRSEKIRTYNFPQNRITDHRIGLTLHNLDKIMDGELDQLIETLKKADIENEKNIVM